MARAESIARLCVFAVDPSEAKLGHLRALGGPASRLDIVPFDRPSVGDHPGLAGLDVVHEMEANVARALAARRWMEAAPTAAPHRLPLTLGTHGNPVGARPLFSYYLQLRLGLRPDDAIICASASSRAALQRHLDELAASLAANHGARLPPPPRLALIPYGCDLELFRPSPRAEARRKLGLRPDGDLVLWHGRIDLENKQDPSPLLVVLRRLLASPERSRPLRLVVSSTAGNPYLALLRERTQHLGIAHAVDIVEGLARADVPLLYAASDVAVCLSDTIIENFGLTAIEAMACGVPVVAADWAGFRDTVRDGETGFLAATTWSEHEPFLDLFEAMEGGSGAALAAQSIATDCDALERVLGTLLQQPELAQRFGDAGRRRAVAEHGTSTMVARHVDLWRELVAATRAAATGDGQQPAPPPAPALRMTEGFAAYPSSWLADTDLLALTSDGLALARGTDVVCVAAVRGQPVEDQAVAAVMAALVALPQASVGEVVARVCGQRAHTPGQTRRHLMWLLKQGYARRLPQP
ncbi:MAG: glycosyltransferase family 4 protein [Deltaproteobacteria bacterium]|nr:glycosyltransferase family 4 protein [Deltaproteobacteria bacterium]